MNTNKYLYIKEGHCDMCHKKGVYNIGGDFICEDCLAIYNEQQENNDKF